MLNVLIADDNMYYVKSLVNFVVGKNSSIKITNIASNGAEVLDILEKNQNIDLILLDLKMPNRYPNIIVISGENRLINKIVKHPLVIDFINKADGMINIYHKLKEFEKELNYLNIKDDLLKKISLELTYIGYNPSHIGTQYIKECILEIYESNNPELIRNLENYVYKKIACIHNKSFQNVKSNIIKATNFMYVESDITLLQNYFHFSDNKRKPTPKMVISTILNKI